MKKILILAGRNPFGSELIAPPTSGSADGTQTGNVLLVQKTGILTIGVTYLVEYDLTMSAGTIRARCGFSGQGLARTVSGSYSEEITCAGNTNFDFLANADFNGTVSNVSVREIL